MDTYVTYIEQEETGIRFKWSGPVDVEVQALGAPDADSHPRWETVAEYTIDTQYTAGATYDEFVRSVEDYVAREISP